MAMDISSVNKQQSAEYSGRGRVWLGAKFPAA